MNYHSRSINTAKPNFQSVSLSFLVSKNQKWQIKKLHDRHLGFSFLFCVNLSGMFVCYS